MKKGRKTTEIEYEQRMGELYEEILYGKDTDVNIKKKKAKEWEQSTRSVSSMIVECRKRIKDKFKESQDVLLEEQVQRYKDLIQDARSKNQNRVVREALKDLNLLFNLEQQKIDITSGNEPISIQINLSPNERESSN